MVPIKIDPQIERRPIGVLRPYERNARKHRPDQIAQIAASIREWGRTMPVPFDDHDLIIAGRVVIRPEERGTMIDPNRLPAGADKAYGFWNTAGAWVAAHPKTAIATALVVVAVVLARRDLINMSARLWVSALPSNSRRFTASQRNDATCQ